VYHGLKLLYVSFRAPVNIAYRILSYRMASLTVRYLRAQAFCHDVFLVDRYTRSRSLGGEYHSIKGTVLQTVAEKSNDLYSSW